MYTAYIDFSSAFNTINNESYYVIAEPGSHVGQAGLPP